MTRILSVFNLLKRVGFAVLFICLVATRVSLICAEWGNEVVLWQNPEHVSVGGGTANIAVDATGKAHVAFSAKFRITENDNVLREGLYYTCIDTFGNVIVPTTLLTDSLYRDVFEPRILLFEPDSLWIMARTSDPSDLVGFRYAALDWEGTLLRPVQMFSNCADVYGSGWWVLRTSDRSVVLVAVSPSFADLRVIVQNPDGTRPMDCDIVFNIRPCDAPMGFVDASDTLQLIWRQFPSWNAVYTKRIGIRDHIPLNSVEDFVPLTSPMPGYMRAAGFVVSLSDTQMLLLEGHSDTEQGIYLRTVDLRTYETVRSVNIETPSAYPSRSIDVVVDSIATVVVRASQSYGIKIRGYRLDDLSVVFETDSLWVTDQWNGRFYPMAYAASAFGHQHVVYSIPPIGGQGGTGQMGYQVWKEGPFTSVREQSDLSKDFQVSAFPNPFNSTTTLRMDLPLGTRNVTITVYNITGQAVEQMEIDVLAPRLDVQLQAENWASGIYLIRAQALGVIQTTKAVLLK